jgi:hypothetical protein
MFRSKTLASSAVALAMIFTAGPALAQGKADRARTAIAHAEGRIQAGDIAGVASTLPEQQAEARNALRTAKEDLAAGRKEDSIANANRASAIAEAALGQTQRIKSAEASVTAQSAQEAAARTQTAETNAAIAQQQAAEAQARAQSAEQTAIAQTVRANEAVAAANSAQVETTVTTETKPAARSAPRKVVKTKVARKPAAKRPATRTATETTQTTVTTSSM